MGKSLHNVSDLLATERSAVEAIFGHALQSDDVLYIATLRLENEPTAVGRNAAWDEVQSITAQASRHAANSRLSLEQLDVLIDSESATVRYGCSE